LSAGRAVTHDMAAGGERQLRDRWLRRLGLATAALGLILTTVGNVTRTPPGRFGMVPDAFVGLQAIALGILAFGLARPHAARAYGRATAWVTLPPMILATLVTTVVALEGLGIIAVENGQPIGLLIAFARATQLVAILLVVWFVVGTLIAAVAGRILGRSDRW